MNATPKRFLSLLTVLATVLALAAMLGCQGISGSSTVKASTQQTAAGNLSVTPPSVNFSNVQPGVSQSQAATLTNSGGASVTITQAPVTGTGFSASGLSLPLTLAAGQSANFNVVFNAKLASSASGNISIASNASNPNLSIPLAAGTDVPATGTLVVSPSSLNFGSVAVGDSVTATEDLTASGADVTVTKASSSSADFGVSGLSFPFTIPSGHSVEFIVSFSPQAAGIVSATLTFDSNANPSTTTETLIGTGTSATGQLAVSPTTLNFGSVAVGKSGTATGSLTASGASVTVTKAGMSNSQFVLSGLTLPVTIAAGHSASFTVTFSPQNTGAISGTLTFTSNANPSTTAANLTGTGTSTQGQLAVSPTTFSMGDVTVGKTGTATGSLTASGASVTVTKASTSNSAFALSGLTLPVTIAAGHSAEFTVSFSPKNTGATSGTLTFNSNGNPSSTVANLTGTGTSSQGQLSVAPTTMNLGDVAVGTSGTGTGKLTATGANVTVNSASSNNSRFAVSGISLPLTIQAGQSAEFTVTFSPLSIGAASATLTFASNASDSTTTDALSGTGTQDTSYTVNLSWNPSTSSDIVGYNVYRTTFGTACGAYAKLNSKIDPSTSYADSSVADGQTYCYVTTAVNSKNQESAYSEPVEAKIP
jgi:ASPM-SPD-2-Hydin domain-containing protein/HYDIN/CFA65/VesB family protein